MNPNNLKNIFSVKNISLIALFVAVISVCSWINVPSVVPFTLQICGIYLCIFLLNPIRSFVCIAIYLLMGLIGVPIFSNFSGGIGSFLGPTGGFLFSFIFLPIFYYPFNRFVKNKIFAMSMFSLFSLFFVYMCGSLWFAFVWSAGSGNFLGALNICVFPYIGFDVLKIAFAIVASIRLYSVINK